MSNIMTVLCVDNDVSCVRVFVECVTFLMNHTDHEGLFRKAGSVSRQKSIRVI